MISERTIVKFCKALGTVAGVIFWYFALADLDLIAAFCNDHNYSLVRTDATVLSSIEDAFVQPTQTEEFCERRRRVHGLYEILIAATGLTFGWAIFKFFDRVVFDREKHHQVDT